MVDWVWKRVACGSCGLEFTIGEPVETAKALHLCPKKSCRAELKVLDQDVSQVPARRAPGRKTPLAVPSAIGSS